jgi:hypothetical protein
MQATFTMKKGLCPPVHINNTEIPQSSTVRYLGLHLDSGLTWKQNIVKKKKKKKERKKEKRKKKKKDR